MSNLGHRLRRAARYVPFSVSYVAGVSSSSATSSYLFEDVAFGDADATRYIHLAIPFAKNSNSAPTSVTIGGVSATILNPVPDNFWLAGFHAYAAVPSGAVGNINLSFSGNQEFVNVNVYRVVGTDKTPPASASANEANSTSVSLTVNRVLGAVMIATGVMYTDNAVAWTNIDEDADTSPMASRRASVASRLNAASGNVSLSYSGTGSVLRNITVCQWAPG